MTCGKLACDLAVEPLPGGAASLEPVTGDGTVRVDALDIPELAARLYRACGQEPPVMLGRPPVTRAQGAVSVRGLGLRPADGGCLTFEIGSSEVTLDAASTRLAAAVAVALADDEEPEDPDEDEAEDVAAAIREAFQGDGTPPTEWERRAARAAIERLRKREARGD